MAGFGCDGWRVLHFNDRQLHIMRTRKKTKDFRELDIDALVALLREQLSTGKALPAERAIAELYAVKRHRVRLALASLREQGDLDPSPRTRLAGGESLIRS